MTGWVILVDQPKDLPNADTPHKVIATGEYLARPRLFDAGRPKLVNLSRSYNYQSKGYYASLLAEARGHRIVPTVETKKAGVRGSGRRRRRQPSYSRKARTVVECRTISRALPNLAFRITSRPSDQSRSSRSSAIASPARIPVTANNPMYVAYVADMSG